MLTGVVTSSRPCPRCDGADEVRWSTESDTPEVLAPHQCVPDILDRIIATVESMQRQVVEMQGVLDGIRYPGRPRLDGQAG